MRILRSLLALLCLLTGVSALAAENVRGFNGGNCELTVQASGLVIDRCKNLTGRTANNIELVATYLDNVTPVRIVSYTNNFGCTLAGLCFGPDVPSGGFWEGANGGTGEAANIVLWRPLPDDFTYRKVILSGNWTYNDETISVPEPQTWSMLIAGFCLVGCLIRRRGADLRSAIQQ